MKTYDGWIDRVKGVSVRVTGRRHCYWLERRKDLLDWDSARDASQDLRAALLWLLAVDLLADVTGVDDLAVRAAPDLVPELHAGQADGEWLMFEEHLQSWTVAWVARQLGLLPARGEVSRG